MVNFCMVNAFFYPYIGGSEKHMYELGKRLAKKYNFHVLTSQLDGTKEYQEIEKMHVHRVKAHMYKMPLIYPPPLVFARQARKKLQELDKEEKFDVINLHGRWFPDFAHAVKYAKKQGKYSTLTLHNKRPLGISPLVSLFGTAYDVMYGKKVLKTTDNIISVSHAAKKDIAEYGLDKKKIHVIHNGVDTKFFKPSEKTFKEKYAHADGFENLLVFQGRLIKQKGIDYLIKGLPAILKEFPDTRLLIVGKGKMKDDLIRQAKKHGIEKNIVFTGFIPENDLPNLFSSADVFVLPSLWEVLPFSLLEALGCGVPLVSSDAGGNPEIVRNDVNGYVFKMRDTLGMINGISKILGDKNLQKKMSKNSRNIALKEFDWEIIAKQTFDFYNKQMI